MLKNLTTKTKSGILIEENSYEYDANNNILKDNSKVYTYDALNRIKTSNDTEYTYDKSGNIASKTVIDGNKIKATTYIYNAKNQLTKSNVLENTALVSETTYGYDLNGNQIEEVTNGQTVTNTYNARNELVKVEKGQAISEYSYNSAGKRIQKTTNDNTINFVYDSDNVILELDENGNEVATNTYGLNLIKRETEDTEGYYVYNGHGDVTKVIDTTNEELNTYVYDEFGSIKEENETFNNPFKYAGYYYDNETKTYYLRSRYYNPEIQRFISEDTYRGELNDPLSLNYYTYVNNNPLIYNDPDGHIPVPLITALIGGIFNSGASIIGDLVTGNDINWRKAGGAFLEGALIGGSLGYMAPLGLGAMATTGVVSGTAGNMINQTITNGYTSFSQIDYKDAVISGFTTGLGVATFGLSGNVTGKGLEYIAHYGLKGAVTAGTINAVDQVLRNNITDFRDINYKEVLTNSALGFAFAPIGAKITESAINKLGPVKINSDGLPISKKITGYTEHGMEQVLGRDGGIGVNNKSILDAVNKPIDVINQSGGRTKYIGQNASVVLNQNGRVITAWPRGNAGVRWKISD